MKKIHSVIALLIATGLLLAIPSANATQKWQDIHASTTITNNSYAAGVCKPALSDWRKKNCSSKTCTARWNGQWRNTTDSSIFQLKIVCLVRIAYAGTLIMA